MSGAASRIRTRDQRFTKPLLYQLSYGGILEHLRNKSPNSLSKSVQTRAHFRGTQPLTRRLLYH